MKARSSNIPEDEQPRLAVLIDADNAQASVIGELLAEVAKYGVASVKRIYGNFTTQQLASWKEPLLKYSIIPVQQFAYTTGKNATDSALIIDAMDLMHAGRLDGFCLVSSDSDFTRLAQRLREQGLIVYGFGQRKTPDAFVQACDKFIYTEVLRSDSSSAASNATVAQSSTPTANLSGSSHPTSPPAPVKAAAPLPSPVTLIRQAIEQAGGEQEWVPLGPVGNYLNKIRPDFDTRLYKKKKLSDLLREYPKDFQLEESSLPGSPAKVLRVRALPEEPF